MNNEMVAHAWAHGREGKGSIFRTDGVTLWSYYTEIATVLDGVIYLSADNMSQTTSRHILYAQRAVGYNTPVFRTTAFRRSGSDPSHNHMALTKPAADAAVQSLDIVLLSNRRQKTKEAAIVSYMQERQRIMEHAARFGLAITMPEYQATPETIAAYQAEKKAAAERAEAARIKAQKKQQALDKKQYKAWLTTGAGRCPSSFITRGADQIAIRGDKVITSQGAECPLDHAVKAVKFYINRMKPGHQKDCDCIVNCGKPVYKECSCSGVFEPYHTNGHRVPLGIFTLDAIDEHGDVKAGCHTFRAAEIQRFINQWKEVLGV